MAVDNSQVARLREQLDALATRVYPEEGIPMFLACEDLASSEARDCHPALGELNGRLAEEFRRDAEAWALTQPDAIDKDAARIVEKFAYCDFVAGGSRDSL